MRGLDHEADCVQRADTRSSWNAHEKSSVNSQRIANVVSSCDMLTTFPSESSLFGKDLVLPCKNEITGRRGKLRCFLVIRTTVQHRVTCRVRRAIGSMH